MKNKFLGEVEKKSASFFIARRIRMAINKRYYG